MPTCMLPRNGGGEPGCMGWAVEPDEVGCALAVAMHPDDIEAWCAGTVAALVGRGARVAYLLLTSGDKGSADPLADPRRIAATREAEQREAAALLGVRDVTFLRHPDGEVEDDPPTRAAIARVIRRVRPDLLVTFDPWHRYTFHHDHREGSLAALAAAYPLARRPGPLPGPLPGAAGDAALAPHAVPGDRSIPRPQTGDATRAPHAARAAWLFNTDRPNRVVDIAATLDAKIAARAAHASQTRDLEAMARAYRERAATAAAPAGLALAEAFHEVIFPPVAGGWDALDG